MNLNQFTQKSVEAVQAAQQMASARQNQQIEQEHLLLALLEQQEGPGRCTSPATWSRP